MKKLDFKGLIPTHQTRLEKLDPSQTWDYGYIKDERKIIDCLLHYSCFMLGYRYPDFIDNVAEMMKGVKPETAETQTVIDDTPKMNHVSYELAEKLYEISGGFRVFYQLSGSDAVEGAVKLAAAYQKVTGNDHKKKIVSMTPGYHGSTLLTSSCAWENAMPPDPFYTLEPYQGVIRVERDFTEDDVDWNEVACILVETCQYGECIMPFSDEFWAKLNHIRDKHNVLIVIDDVFMGGGKTGHFIGWKHLPIVPDIFTQGKSITGGYFPLSITYYNDKIHKALGPDFEWNHGYTYSFAVAGICSTLEYLRILERDKLLDNTDALVERATKVFTENHFSIAGRFGLHFTISIAGVNFMYLIPLNADDEYFDALDSNLKELFDLAERKLGYSLIAGGR